jgi:peptidoglycan/xylan/chitin deacetylase (PgdA/CDA1 family)
MNNLIALSFDIEDLDNIKSKNISDNFSDDYLTLPTMKILDLLDELNIQATFFVVSNTIKKYKSLFSRLKSSNHEIACHSLNHYVANKNYSSQQFIANWEMDLRISLDQLSQFFGKKIIGFRAPGAYFHDWMIDILIENDIKYDSSITTNSFYKKTNIDISEISTGPVLFKHSRANNYLTELPWSSVDLKFIRIPAGGAFFYRILGNKYFFYAIKQCLKVGDTMFYMHPLDFSDANFSGLKRSLYWTNKGSNTFSNFSELLVNFQGLWSTCELIHKRTLSLKLK